MAQIKTDVKLHGLKELLQTLKQLPPEVHKKAVYPPLMAAGRIVRDAAIERAPVLAPSHPSVQAGVRTPGTVRNAIRVSRSKINKGQNSLYEVIVRVRPLGAKARRTFKQATGLQGKDNPNDPYYWWWVEFGTSKSPAQPFMRPGFESTKGAQLNVVQQRFYRTLGRIVTTLAKAPPRA